MSDGIIEFGPDRQRRIEVLLEEYRALYGLLQFRLSAMDRRLPTAGGALWAALSSTPVMPPDTRQVFLIGLPAALVWLVLSTVQHARSKEDHLRRIDEIERMVNSLAGEELLVFQSRHPNRAELPGGRTALNTTVGVLAACMTMLVACVLLELQSHGALSTLGQSLYQVYALACGVAMIHGVLRLRWYRYNRSPARPRPIAEFRGDGTAFATISLARLSEVNRKSR